MLETPEARAKLRRKLETWPDDRKSPVTINQGLELLDLVERLEEKLHKTEMHEHYMMQWAQLDMEEAHKTVDWVYEIQAILGLEVGMTKNSRAEITAKIKELMTADKEADWRSGQILLGENSRLEVKADYMKIQYDQLKEKYKELWNTINEIMEKAEQLEKEVNWLADELIMSESKKCPICDCPQKAPDSPTEADAVVFWNGCRKCWRDAARKAVE